MLRVHHGVVIRNLFPLDIQGKSSFIKQLGAIKAPSAVRGVLTDNGCFFSSNMSRERFESLKAQNKAHKLNKHRQRGEDRVVRLQLSHLFFM